MRRLSTIVLVYSQREVGELALRSPRSAVEVAPNALYSRSRISAVSASSASPADIIVSGRLVPDKKPRLILSAFAQAASDLRPNLRLVFAGDGPELAELQALAQKHGLSKRVVFLGHVPASAMQRHYAGALFSASPGYVGLALIQSISNGIPMLVARDEPHAPEIEAAVDNLNVRWVASDDVAGWARALIEVDRDRATWIERRHEIAAHCAARYSFEAMAAGFIRAVGT
jgi:glycosyltransferase involved in cell wall biosynthesis